MGLRLRDGLLQLLRTAHGSAGPPRRRLRRLRSTGRDDQGHRADVRRGRLDHRVEVETRRMTTTASTPAAIGRRQIFVLLIAYLGWVFDLMDVFLMVLVKDRAMAELLGPGASQREIGVWGGWALGITLVGWSAGGLL